MLTDLEIAEVMLEAPLSGRFDLAVPDLLEAYGERQKHDARQLAKYDFTIIELDDADVEKTLDYLRRYPALTLHDVWALYLCASRGRRLLTRSSQLTSAATDAGVVTHSTLWLFDQLVVAGCLSPWDAVAAVRQMQSRGRGLSQARCDRFIEKCDRPR